MKKTLKKTIRTLQIQFPVLQNYKFNIIRFIRNQFKIPFEQDFKALSLLPIPKDALFLDVGANRGQSTDAIFMNVDKQIRLQLFEPNQFLCKKLSKFFGDNSQVTIKNFGLGDENTTSPLFVPFYNQWMFDGLASFVEYEAVSWLQNRVFFYNQELLKVQKTDCQVKKLDDLNVDPFFMKLDVQGYELAALKGGEQTIKKHKPILLIENPDELDLIIDYLREFGYQIYAFQEGKFILNTKGHLNTFFMTPDKLALADTVDNRTASDVELSKV